MMTDYYLNFIYPALAVGAIVAVFLMSFKNGRNDHLSSIQQQTITALQTQINILKDKISGLEKENALQGHLIETVTSALKHKGLIVTIDGDMITISGKDGTSSSSIRPQRKITTTKTVALTQQQESEKS